MSHQGWRRSTLAGGAASGAAAAPAAMASSAAQSVSVLREGTTLQMRCVSGLELDDLSRTFLDLAIMNSPVDVRIQAKKLGEAERIFETTSKSERDHFCVATKAKEYELPHV